MKRLSEIKNIVGVKDATANLARVVEQRLACGKDFIQLSGEDGTAVAFNAQGGVGCTLRSVERCVAVVVRRRCSARHWQVITQKRLEILVRLTPLIKALFAGDQPAPAKYALSLLGKCSEDIRLPAGDCQARRSKNRCARRW